MVSRSTLLPQINNICSLFKELKLKIELLYASANSLDSQLKATSLFACLIKGEVILSVFKASIQNLALSDNHSSFKESLTEGNILKTSVSLKLILNSISLS